MSVARSRSQKIQSDHRVVVGWAWLARRRRNANGKLSWRSTPKWRKRSVDYPKDQEIDSDLGRYSSATMLESSYTVTKCRRSTARM